MPDRLTGQTYLVEHYGPGVRAEELERLATRVRDTIIEMRRQGSAVAYVSSTIVPGDDYLHCVLRAPSEQLVRDVLSRAGMAHDRISAAISVAGPSDDDAPWFLDVGAPSSAHRDPPVAR
ncbi:MAG: hypothetical protein QOJ35_3954 [Solirubrobacteraceae bacterium]|jgi:hypothetical protein|nr:hypothetical protein [Solirubrobacteraceae bacterium]